MWLSWYKHSSFLELPVFAMFIFMIAFSVVVLRVIAFGVPNQTELERIPLRDDSSSRDNKDVNNEF
jgi:hypothetical protein